MTARPSAPLRGVARFAPSPSGEFHLGNLRTALLAWTIARRTGHEFCLRIDDLDRVQRGAEAAQLRDLGEIGITWERAPVRQSTRLDQYSLYAAELWDRGLVYECYCSRRDIQEAPRAPHAPPGAYPGTCRSLTPTQRAARRAALGGGRRPAWRLRTDTAELAITDRLHGTAAFAVDDLVIRRGDGVWAYNFTTVVDDITMGVTQIVRGEDLLSSTSRQAYLLGLFSAPRPEWWHVPLVLNARRERLAKRDGAVTLTELRRLGLATEDVVELLAESLGVTEARTAAEVCAALDLRSLGKREWVFRAPAANAERPDT